MMPLINRLLAPRKNSKTNKDCKLPINIGTGLHIRNTVNLGADQIRILLFRECEWRGRKLLFDSITAGKSNGSNSSRCSGTNTSCPRSGNGLPHECEKEVCNNVNLLSEMVFGTVAMTYRGTLFKIHTLEFPRCIMCTKVFPAPDHNTHKTNDKNSHEKLGRSLSNNNDDLTASSGSMRHTLTCQSSGNVSANSLRKSSTCSSTCSGWDFDLPVFPIGNSEQSLEANSHSTSSSSSGFGSYPSLRRRWLRALSTSLINSDVNEMDEILGFQVYGNSTIFNTVPVTPSVISTCDDNCDSSIGGSSTSSCRRSRHKTRLALTIMIRLTPEREKEMELRLFEHATQLEAILDMLCNACINNGKERGLIERLHQASFRCTCCLLRLLVRKENYCNNLSIWHEIILNKCITTNKKSNMLCRNFQQMCQLLDTIDTKSTNFFLSTLITAVLTYHLGWINTVVSMKENSWLENMKNKYPCNPLWVQLSDLYGTFGNPPKKVHTIIAGDAGKTTLIDAILTFLSYFIRSALVERNRMCRDTSGKDVEEAVTIVENKQKTLLTTPFPLAAPSASSSTSYSSSVHPCFTCPPVNRLKKKSDTITSKTQFLTPKKNDISNIPRLRKTSSLQRNLNVEGTNCLKLEDKLTLKLDSYQDDLDGGSEKGVNNSRLVKIVVNGEKDLSKTLMLDEYEDKSELRSSAVFPIDPKISSLYLDSDYDSMKQVRPINATNGFEETTVYFSQTEYERDKQSQVLFTVGEDDKSVSKKTTIQTNNNCPCQCSFAFTRVPSTSAQLPEGVLRKILQRNFPESSKSIQRPGTSLSQGRSFCTSCPKCNGSNTNRNYESNKLLLETPTNATEVLRTCGVSTIGTRGGRNRQSNLDELLEDNNFVELPMPRYKTLAADKNPEDSDETSGYTNTLLEREIPKSNGSLIFPDVHYPAGLIIQGLIKKSNRSNKRLRRDIDAETNTTSSIQPTIENWLSSLRDDISMTTKYPLSGHSIPETLYIVADTDNWQVGLMSNAIPMHDSLLSVGMSRLVSRMLEAFVYLWTKHKSPVHCFNILEFKMREMWLISVALAEMIMTMDLCNINLTSLTSALDLDAADVPLLLAIATTHTPQILQRIGFTYT